MGYENKTQAYIRRSSAVPAAFFTSLGTSAVVTVALLWLTGNLQSFKDLQEGQAAGQLRKVPALIGLTTETARDVLRARDLRLVVQGEQPDSNVVKGKISEQDPLADSELVKGGEVRVTLSSGAKKQTVPIVVGKPLEEAKATITATGLVVGQVIETGTGEPGTVTDVQPKPGTEVDDGSEVTLIISPPGVAVPDVVNSYLGKAKKTIEEAGLKPGKIRWGYNDYKDPNVILSQEPAAGTTVAKDSTVDLVVNEED